jgi:sugar phosphate isomerase/epimerase
MDSIDDLCERLNRGQAAAREVGATLTVHNHWWEYEKLNGELVADLMLARLDPEILFELDTYWIKVGGEDPAEIVARRGKRAPLLHIKDGPGVREEPMTAIGDGIMNFPSIFRAGGEDTLWWIYEADRLAGDIMTAVQKSYTYMKGLLK